MKRTLNREIRLSGNEVAEAVIFWLASKDIPTGKAPELVFYASRNPEAAIFPECLITSVDQDDINLTRKHAGDKNG